MINKIIITWIEIVLLLIFTNIICFSQTGSKIRVLEANETWSCEFVSAIVDSFAQGTNSDKTIIVISYQGEKESKPGIAKRRLHNIKTYLTEYFKGTAYSRLPNKIITAIGNDKSKEGRLDFYVDGNLNLRMFFMDNRDIRLSPCHTETKNICEDEIQKLLYPCFEFNQPKKSKTKN